MCRTLYRRRTFLSLTILKSNAENADHFNTCNIGHGYELNYYFLLYIMVNVLWIEAERFYLQSASNTTKLCGFQVNPNVA